MENKNMYEATSDRLLHDISFMFNPDSQWKEIFAGAKPSDRVLEIGAGTGKCGLMFCIYAGCDVTLMDVDADACRYQLRLIKTLDAMSSGRSPVIIRHQDIFTDDVKPRYDIVFSEGVVEHYVGERRQRMIDLHYESTLDKAIIITTNGDNAIAVAKATSRTEEFELATMYERPYRRLELQAAMEASGFSNVKVDRRAYYIIGVGRK